MKVNIYTQVYNAEKYLKQCIDSVLQQTYQDFEFILIDNGSTDGSKEILEEYTRKNKNIQLIRFEENILYPRWLQLVAESKNGEYLTRLDSDDWWEPHYLERMVHFLEMNHLDLAITGTIQYLEEHHTSQILRRLEQTAILTQNQFAQHYPQFWTFPSTTWASVMKMNIVRFLDYDSISKQKYPYGGDTLMMLEYIKHCSRIGIDNSALYHYRIHPKSVTYQYNPRRFDANIACYEQIKEFLELHQTCDSPKQEWLKQVHLSSMLSTLNLLKDSKLSSAEKLAECARIVEHPLTALALTNQCSERDRWFSLMWEIVFSSAPEKIGSSAETLYAVLHTLAPSCAAALHSTDLGLFVRESELQKSLQEDDREKLAHQILNLISQKKYTKQYDLGRLLCGLIPDDSLLQGISDTRFFREYAESCTLVIDKKYSEALEQMTGVLFQKKKLYAGEVFLSLYVTVAALESEVTAFLFGKHQLALFYLDQDRLPECRAILNELVEIGAENEELTALRQQLEEIGG